jgi:23S rRNA (cytosine1962-C5)-methyltransferase
VSYRALTLSEQALGFVTAGGRDLAMVLVPEARDLEAGRPVRLVGPDAHTAGLALADTENDTLRVLSGPGEPFDAIDASLCVRRVASALALRRDLGLLAADTACRVLHGAGDAVPGFTADLFGRYGVLSVYARALQPLARDLALALRESADLEGVVLKVRGRGAASQGRVRQDVVGQEPPESLVVTECGVPFEVHLTRGLNTGLFCDMRGHRHGLSRLAAGKDVWNGFSYTGSLSVVAARAGARSVTSVDLSSGVQNWARDNFRLSGLDPHDGRFHFLVDDVGRALAEAHKERRRFDLVLLDPPAFSAARGAGFALDRDYPDLIARAARLVPSGGLVWLSANARGTDLVSVAQEAFRSAGRQVAVLETGGLPPDHPTLPAQAADRYLQVVLFRLA